MAIRDALQGAAGAGAAFGPWGALAGGILGGFLNKRPSLPPELQRLYKLQYGAADQLRRFAQSPALSDPAERGAFAQQRAQLGQQQEGQMQQLQGQLQRNNQGSYQNLADFTGNLGSQQIGQQMALQGSHLFNALASRRQAYSQASDIASSAANTFTRGREPGQDFGALFGQLASMISYRNAQNAGDKQQRSGGGAGGEQPGGTLGDSPQAPPYQGGYGGSVNAGEEALRNAAMPTPYAPAPQITPYSTGIGPSDPEAMGRIGAGGPALPPYGGVNPSFAGPAWEWARRRGSGG